MEIDIEQIFAVLITIALSNVHIVPTIKALQDEINNLTDVYVATKDYSTFKENNKNIYSNLHSPLIILFITTSNFINWINEIFPIINKNSAKWIYFHDNKFEALKIFETTNIPISNEVYTIPLIYNCTTTFITEYYNVQPWKNLEEHQIGFWNFNEGLVIKESISNRRENLRNITILIATKHAPPFTALDNTTNPTALSAGMFGHIWNILEEKRNFSSRIVVPSDNGYGFRSENGSWSGMLGLLYRNDASVAVCDFTLTSIRQLYFDIAYPIVTSRHLLVIREPENHDFYWSNFSKPFSFNLWITFISVFLTGGICVFIIIRFKKEFSMDSSASGFVMFQIFSQQGNKPKFLIDSVNVNLMIHRTTVLSKRNQLKGVIQLSPIQLTANDHIICGSSHKFFNRRPIKYSV